MIIRTKLCRDGWHATLDGELVAIHSDRFEAEGQAMKIADERGIRRYRVVSW